MKITMRCFIPLLVTLCSLTALGRDYIEYTETGGDYEYVYDESTDSPATVNETSEHNWLFELLNITDHCAKKPCENGGSCENTVGGFVCHCQDPFTGNTCRQVKAYCKDVTCGRGTCVFKPIPPYYECKCSHPFRPPDCRKAVTCRPNPCQNGGTCLRSTVPKSTAFLCSCPTGFTGKLCEVGPSDCFEGDGGSYRGNVSLTVDGEECLEWNSYFIMREQGDRYIKYAAFSGIGAHHFCRNPDGDSQPWCFYKQNQQLLWKYCDIRECTRDPETAAPPTPPATAPDLPAPAVPFSQCGKPQPAPVEKVYRGTKSVPGARPWQVSFQMRPTEHSATEFTHMCGGILISSCWVLTAAHCIKSDVEMQIVVGGVRLDKQEASDQIVPVEKVIIHKDYTKTIFAIHNDIALLKLKVIDDPFCAKEARFVKTACLPNQMFQSGTECVISGWGHTETQNHKTKSLREARVFLIPQDQCKAPRVYGDSIDDSEFCAGYLTGGVDSCEGDSGGPLVCERDDTFYVVGVVSYGDGCGKKYKPGIYANVAKFIDWIMNNLSS